MRGPLAGIAEWNSRAGRLLRGAGDYFAGLGDYFAGLGDYFAGLGDYFAGLGDYFAGLGDYFRGAGRLLRGAGRQAPGCDHRVGLAQLPRLHPPAAGAIWTADIRRGHRVPFTPG